MEKKICQERWKCLFSWSSNFKHPKVWEASGHVESFSDPLIDCKNCKTRHRVDNLIEDYDKTIDVDRMTEEEMIKYIRDNKVPCPKCGSHDFTDLRDFNLMFKTTRGVVEEKQSTIYLNDQKMHKVNMWII